MKPPDLLEAALDLLLAQPGGQARTRCLEDAGAHVVGASYIPPETCPACALRRAIAHEQGLRANARIRTEPLLPVVRTHDAQGARRTGRVPEQDNEGEE